MTLSALPALCARDLAVQHECIPQAVLGQDVICQAKSGMGKTAVFVISVLQQLEPVDGEVSVLVLCHTRELAFQITHEFERFTTYLKSVRVAPVFGGVPIKQNIEMLKNKDTAPHVLVGTAGRVKALVDAGALDLSHLRIFVVDECDKCLESVDMRADVQSIFRKTPHDKQVMMFSATLSPEIRPVVKKFMRDVRPSGGAGGGTSLRPPAGRRASRVATAERALGAWDRPSRILLASLRPAAAATAGGRGWRLEGSPGRLGRRRTPVPLCARWAASRLVPDGTRLPAGRLAGRHRPPATAFGGPL